MPQQHILIVLNDGRFQGASIRDEKGDPSPLDLSALAALIPDINEAAIETLAQSDAKVATAEQSKAEALTKLAAVLAAADSDDIATVKAKAAEAKLDEKARKIAELEKQKAEIEKQIDEARNPKAESTVIEPKKGKPAR